MDVFKKISQLDLLYERMEWVMYNFNISFEKLVA